jgi:2-keto-4-pentenoate hydratase/2-oxohepta-3-ene-1,7-dioic acid hydratase in catechol pathway
MVAVTGTTFVDVSDVVEDFNPYFFSSGGLNLLKDIVPERLAKGLLLRNFDERIGAPISSPQQIICIGLNYADHATETGAEIPPEPIIFTKAPNTLVGPNDAIKIPKGSSKTDWEIELGVVIKKQARYLESPEQASNHIAGYVLVNDVSEREFQLERQGQWTKGKSCETFNPAGPFLATVDEIDNILDLSMSLSVNGQNMQNSSTRQMIYTPAFLIQYLSQFMVLEAGDLINTGTPAGVGLGKKPQRFLKAGDLVELEIEGLGRQCQKIINYDY